MHSKVHELCHKHLFTLQPFSEQTNNIGGGTIFKKKTNNERVWTPFFRKWSEYFPKMIGQEILQYHSSFFSSLSSSKLSSATKVKLICLQMKVISVGFRTIVWLLWLFMFIVNRLATNVPHFCNLNVHGFNCCCNVFQHSKTFKYMLGAVILLGCSVQLLQFDWSVVQMVQVHFCWWG